MIESVLFFVGLIPALFILFAIGIQYQNTKLPKPLIYILMVVAMIGAIVDIIANYTTFTLIFMEAPRKGEFTFSERLYRLQNNTDWRGFLARPICVILNKIAPVIHIKPNPN